ncbi:MAG: TldD/PmbA family protein [Myxococcales bacterium]|nr:TldD/PmbA family protein [Myxococcales bacterium]MCB9752428.1 TldD/PmbA family protein [Myxococcales bacterium]
MTLSKAEIKKITQTAIKAATVPELEVRVEAAREGNLRFANNEATTSGDVERLTVSVTASEDRRSATVSGNRRDAAGVRALVEKAQELCRLSPVDPEHMPALGAQRYAAVTAHDKLTARIAAEERANLAAKLIRAGNLRKLVASGLVRARDHVSAVANKQGLWGYFPSTDVSLTTTMRTRDGTGSGWASAASYRVGALDPEAVALAAADKGEMSQGPQAIKPGRYTVILEPQAVADLLWFLVYSLDARAADEGRSFFSRPGGGTRIGETLFHRDVTIRSDPGAPEHPSSPIGRGGLALAPTTWIEGGALKQLAYSRFWAQRQGASPVPRPRSLLMAGSRRSLAELVRGVDRGVLVTRFWYNRMVDPRTILATGLTRDGTFLVEQGKISRPVKNMRYNESPVTILKNVLALGAPARVGDGEVSVVPPIVVHDFNFASVSDAV